MIATLATLAQTVTALPVAPAGDKLTSWILALTAALIGLAEAIRRLLALRGAVVAIVKGTEEALDPLKVSNPDLYRKTKDALKTAIGEAGAEPIVAPIVEDIHQTKPHTPGDIAAPKEEDVR